MKCTKELFFDTIFFAKSLPIAFFRFFFCFSDFIQKDEAFLKKNNRREQRYQWKIKKQKQDAKIHTELSLDEIKKTSGGDEYLIADLIEDTVHHENSNTIEITIDKEEQQAAVRRDKKLAAIFDKFYSEILTKKQYEVFKLQEEGYCASDIAKLLNDESSVRERLKNAQQRIENYKSEK